jgi:hypothetical protein
MDRDFFVIRWDKVGRGGAKFSAGACLLFDKLGQRVGSGERASGEVDGGCLQFGWRQGRGGIDELG